MSSQEVLNGRNPTKSIHLQAQGSRFPKQTLKKILKTAELIYPYDFLFSYFLKEVPLNIRASTDLNFLNHSGGALRFGFLNHRDEGKLQAVRPYSATLG